MLYKSLFVLVDVFGKFGVFVLSVEIYQRVVHLVHPEKSGATWHPPPAPLLPILMPLLLFLLLLLLLLFVHACFGGSSFQRKMGNLFSEVVNCANISDDKVGLGKKKIPSQGFQWDMEKRQ